MAAKQWSVVFAQKRSAVMFQQLSLRKTHLCRVQWTSSIQRWQEVKKEESISMPHRHGSTEFICKISLEKVAISVTVLYSQLGVAAFVFTCARSPGFQVWRSDSCSSTHITTRRPNTHLQIWNRMSPRALMQNQHTRELISTWKTSHKHNKDLSKRVKLHQRYMLKSWWWWWVDA